MAAASSSIGSPATGSPAGGPSGAKGPLRLTPGRIAALAIGVPAALALIANCAFTLLAPFAQGRYAVSYTAPASTTSLTVDSDGGQFSIRPAAADRVTIHGTARYTFIRSTFTAQTTGGDTAMKYECVPLPSSDCALNATVSVPGALPVNTSTDGGNVSVTGISAPVTLHSAGGNLSADNIAGPLNLSTSGGNIRLTAIPARQVTASSGGGDISASDVSAPTVVVRTSGGNIRADGVTSQQVTASSGGGDIKIVFTRVPASVKVDTSGGNITLVLPAGPTEYNVFTQTAGGKVADELPHNKASEHAITATTGGGDITLTRQQ